MIYLISALILLIYHFTEKPLLFPDGSRYFEAGKGVKLYKPFHLRWLLPFVCRQSETKWNIIRYGSLFFLPVLTEWYLLLQGLTETQSLIGACLVIGLPGVYRMNFIGKYLCDGFGMLMSMKSAICFIMGEWQLGIVVSLIGSMANEKVFIFSALYSFNPLALIGGVSVLIRYLASKPADKDILGEHNHELLDHPFKTGLKHNSKKLFDIQYSLLPYGVCILALIGLVNINILQFVLTTLIAYSMVFIATDFVRLAQWGYPVWVWAAVTVIPVEYAILLIVIHLLNPYRRNYL